MEKTHKCVVPYSDEEDGVHWMPGALCTLLRVERDGGDTAWAVLNESGSLPAAAFALCFERLA